MIEPMLAENADHRRIEKMILDDEWFMEQKLDGVRLLIHVNDGKVVGWKRSGNVGDVPLNAQAWFATFKGEWIFDGEFLDNVFWIFDMPLAASGKVGPNHAYLDRRNVLDNFFAQLSPPRSVRLLPSARTPEEKRALYDRCVAENAEGVMLKRADMQYRHGYRSNTMLKCKFVQTADCIVTEVGRDGKTAAVLGLVEMVNGKPTIVECGKCSLIGKPAVKVGDVVEVKYLYATADRRLYQPRLMKLRDDKAMHECDFSQLKFTSREVLV